MDNLYFNFEELKVPEPPLFSTYEKEEKENIYLYLSGLDDHNKKIYKIAHEHLETSFNIVKSNGYIKWLKQRE